MLQALGVSTEAECLYVQIAGRHESSIETLAHDHDAEEVRTFLEQLVSLGLIYETEPARYRALPLPDAARSIRERCVAELDAGVRAADTMNLHVLKRQSAETDIEVLIGPDAASVALRDLCSNAQTEIAAFDRPPYVEVYEPTMEYLATNSPEYQALDRGVSVRGVYNPGFDKDRLTKLALFVRHGEHAKFGDVPMKLILIDRRTAVLPAPQSYAADQNVRVTVVRHPIVVEALQSLFESVWERSVTVALTDTGGLKEDPRRDALVALLMGGSTDSAIASRFKVTERSIRRWIADLMEELDVQTRLQLGAALARSESFRKDTRRLV